MAWYNDVGDWFVGAWGSIKRAAVTVYDKVLHPLYDKALKPFYDKVLRPAYDKVLVPLYDKVLKPIINRVENAVNVGNRVADTAVGLVGNVATIAGNLGSALATPWIMYGAIGIGALITYKVVFSK